MNIISFTVAQIAKRHNFSRQTIYVELNAGRLRSYKVGKSRRITEQAEAEWIAEQEAASLIWPTAQALYTAAKESKCE